VSELSAAELEEMANTEMDARHNHLNVLLEPMELTPQEAVARTLELSKGNHLPHGMTIRDLTRESRP
jgi:hypothetical protein